MPTPMVERPHTLQKVAKCFPPSMCLMTEPFKKPRLSYSLPSTTSSLQPVGTPWSNNSCAYDVVVTIFFNIWYNAQHAHQLLWAATGNNLMTSLLDGFQNHTNRTSTSSHSLSLETIRDNFRQLLANISSDFEFGEFASAHDILEQLLESGQPVISFT